MKHLVFTAVFAFTAGTASAWAEEARHTSEARLVTVRHADLDLARTDDAASLLSRLQYAATRACNVEAVRSPSPALRRAVEQCRADAIAEAVAQLDSPSLTQLHAAQTR